MAGGTINMHRHVETARFEELSPVSQDTSSGSAPLDHVDQKVRLDTNTAMCLIRQVKDSGREAGSTPLPTGETHAGTDSSFDYSATSEDIRMLKEQI